MLERYLKAKEDVEGSWFELMQYRIRVGVLGCRMCRIMRMAIRG